MTRSNPKPTYWLVSIAALPLASIGDEIALRSRLHGLDRAMCEKCIENTARIGRYRWVRRAVSDRQTSEAIDVLIGELDAEITALHPTTNQQAGNPRQS